MKFTPLAVFAAMTFFLCSAFLCSAAQAQQNQAQQNQAAQAQQKQAETRPGVPADTQPIENATRPEDPTHAAWGIETAEIPAILRLHCSALRNGLGVLVQKSAADGVAARLGVQPGDVILEINGSPIAQTLTFPPAAPMAMMMVLRRGQPTMLPPNPMPRVAMPRDPMPRVLPPAFEFPELPQQPWRGPAPIPAPWSGVANGTGGVSASSYATGNQAVSVSRVGDRISIELSIPELSVAPIRFSGTSAQIQQQIQNSQLSEPAKRTVRQAVGI